MRHGMNPTREDEEKSRVSAMFLLSFPTVKPHSLVSDLLLRQKEDYSLAVTFVAINFIYGCGTSNFRFNPI